MGAGTAPPASPQALLLREKWGGGDHTPALRPAAGLSVRERAGKSSLFFLHASPGSGRDPATAFSRRCHPYA